VFAIHWRGISPRLSEPDQVGKFLAVRSVDQTSETVDESGGKKDVCESDALSNQECPVQQYSIDGLQPLQKAVK